MDFLLLFVGEGKRLDRAMVKRALVNLPGVRGVEDREGEGWTLQARFDDAGDSTIIRLVQDEESISISGIGDASLRAAVEIQSRLAADLRVVDSDYSFELPLRGVENVADLRKRIANARDEAAREA